MPYVGWTAYATLLTAKFWIDNPQARCGAARARAQRRLRHALGGGRRADSPPPSPGAPGRGGRPSSAAAAASAAAAPASAAVAASEGGGAAAVADEIDAAGRAARAKVASAKAA